MKTKYLVLGTGVLIAACGLWFGRAAWRAHQQLVTLNVRNLPLADVLRKIERQTWKKIRVEKNLDARITLHVSNKPLSYVLDRLAEQAGARWSTLYAVYDSGRALKALDTALCGDGKLEPAGWTKLAPNPPALKPPGPDEIGPHPHPGPAPGDSGPMAGQRGMMMFRHTGNGATVMQNPNGQVEFWSAEELVMESALYARLGSERSETATSAAAAETARKVKGRWTTYLAFRKSSMGMAGPPPGRPGLDPVKRDPNDRFARLTPEQRVARARERLELNLELNQK
ncbi:MAG TPA: hypothetical protein VEL06_01895 [Haliangiales bacterium]|nr:hypothetical protein [Haliangiales bacterium]